MDWPEMSEVDPATTGRHPAWMRWAALVVGLLATGALVLGLYGWIERRWGIVPTAGNQTIYFLSDVQGQNYHSAYGRLCGELRSEHPFDEFEASRGLDVSASLDASTWSGTDTVAVRDDKTLSKAVTSTWEDDEAKWVDVKTGTFTRIETWRISSEREGRSWKVCSFAKR